MPLDTMASSNFLLFCAMEGQIKVRNTVNVQTVRSLFMISVLELGQEPIEAFQPSHLSQHLWHYNNVLRFCNV